MKHSLSTIRKKSGSQFPPSSISSVFTPISV